MQIEIGKTYRTRDGSKATIHHVFRTRGLFSRRGGLIAIGKFESKDASGVNIRWALDGSRKYMQEDALDILEEWKD